MWVRMHARLQGASGTACAANAPPCWHVVQGHLVAERYDAAQGVDAATALISWSLAKSVTSAVLGVRTADPGLAPFSVAQLAGSPVWNASETAARNITRACCDISHCVLGMGRPWAE